MNPKKEPDLSEAMQLAQSPAGKQLLDLLRQKNTVELQNALEKARSGDFEQARDAINALLTSPDAKALLEQLGGNP